LLNLKYFASYTFIVSVVLPYPDCNNTLRRHATACCCVAVPDKVWHTNELVTLLTF